MGSSGAGKTTFMNTLARRNLAGLEVEGEINLNGIPSSPENMQKLSGETLFFN
jgi:ABC-type multidrug transport system ATPase subunit